MNHFKDDTNLLNFNSCVKSVNKQTNYDLKSLANWLNFSKVQVNVDKAELGLFHSPKKQLDAMQKGSMKQISRIFGNSNLQKFNMETTD